MRVIALGVGGAFTDRFYQTNYLVDMPGYQLLIDAGTTLRYSLVAAGYTAKDISAIALTHFHSDHVGGLEEFSQRCRYLYQYRPTIYAMPDQVSLLTSLFALHGTKPGDYLNVKAIAGEKPIVVCDTEDAQYQLEYYSTLGLHAEVTSNYIVCIRRIGSDNKAMRVIFTGDIGPIEKSDLGRLAADPETAAVFHDCHTGSKRTPAHPSLEQMTRFYPPEQRGKIYVIHYGDNIAEYTERIQGAGFKVAIQGEAVEWQ
jgi:ribonuclease BN (tRNA processing enzyme)